MWELGSPDIKQQLTLPLFHVVLETETTMADRRREVEKGTRLYNSVL